MSVKTHQSPVPHKHYRFYHKTASFILITIRCQQSTCNMTQEPPITKLPASDSPTNKQNHTKPTTCQKQIFSYQNFPHPILTIPPNYVREPPILLKNVFIRTLKCFFRFFSDSRHILVSEN